MYKFTCSISLILILVLFACSNPVDKINPKELKTACDCAKAAELIITERLDIQESNIGKDIKDIDTAKLMKRWNELIAKQDLVFKNCTGKKELLNCKDWSKTSKELSDRTLEINQKSEAAAIKKKAN
jgi:hypothetical protein